MITSNLHDVMGVPISVGDTIVYPGRKGSDMWLNKGIVVTFGEYMGVQGVLPYLEVVPIGKADRRVVTLTAVGRVAVVNRCT